MVHDVAAKITPLVHTLEPAELTAVSLQMAATNVPAQAVPDFYAACISRAQEVAHLCALQQLTDLSWAFFRAQVPIPEEFSDKVRDSALLWAYLRLGDMDNLPTIRRECAHEAANFLFRLSKANLILPDDSLSAKMLFIVTAGASQVCPAIYMLLHNPS